MGALKFIFKSVIFIVILLGVFIFLAAIFGDKNKESAGSQDVVPEIIETEYASYSSDDFSVDIPDWNLLNDTAGDERILGVTKGVCSVIVNKYTARPQDIDTWIKQNLAKAEGGKNLISSSENGIYYFEFQQLYEQYMVTSKNKMFYCNYVTYVTTVMCVNELMTAEDLERADYILESAKCDKLYEVPNLQEERKEVEQESPEEAEVIGGIEDEIVKTNVGEEFGIDEEMVVYFINGNDFFKKILKDFHKINMRIEDSANNRTLELRVIVNELGEIVSLEDGIYDDIGVTLVMPLRDALNIFSNAANLNPFNLISFAINVQTIPQEIKNEVIQKVLRGEYN